MSRQLATLLGVLALIFWATLVGLLRISTANFGAMHTVTYVYTISAILLYFTYGLPPITKESKKFILISSLFFVVFEMCYAFSITLANTSEKSIELNIIFNLWPTLTIIFMAFMKEEKVNLATIIGVTISFLGVVLINYRQGINIVASISENPLSYFLIFLSSILWAVYCLYTKKQSNGVNAVSLYFILTACTLWVLLLSTKGFDFPKVTQWTSYLIICINAFFFAAGYLAWNIGIIKGNISVLVMLSYFAPIMSSLFSMTVLNSNLSSNFWYGCFIVTFGSVISWLSLRKKQVIHHTELPEAS